MAKYALRRLILIFPTIFILTIVLFTMFRLIPGNTVDLMVAQNQSQSGTFDDLNRDAVMKMLGLDVPLHVQYIRWMGNILHGDLGTSMWTNRSLTEELKSRLPITLELSLFAMVISLGMAIPIGIFAAIRQDTIGDYIGRTWSILAMSTPGFWIATLVITYAAIWWNWTPALRYIPFFTDPIGNLVQFILPAFIMGMFSFGGTMRLTRTMMLEVLKQDYIRTAWSKGLRERVVVIRHAARNTLIPVVTIIGGLIPGLLGGSVIMEQIFDLPGMGRYLLESITRRDYNVVSGYNLVMATFVMVMVLLTDLAYAYVDPRVHYK